MNDLSIAPRKTSLRKRLLLVEDDASVVASLKMFLKSSYEVHSASTVSSGVSLFKSLEPSMVVLDLRLSDGDGLDVLREIRCIDAKAPVIVLTGYASMKSVEESLRLGASDYLHKPFDGFTLKSRIDQLVAVVPPPRRKKHAVPTSLPEALQRIAELELQAQASAMFLHDAASPMTTALTASHFLCDLIGSAPGFFDQDTRDIADLLHGSMGFIAGLFEQSRHLGHLSRLEVADVPIHKIVDLAVSLTKPYAQNRKVTFSVHLQKPNATVRVNRFALARVLLNLLRNAVEAVKSDTGRVNLLVDATDGYAEFSVLDNGPGIPDNLIKQIFEVHFTTKSEGSGLGLFICKRLVEAMKGTLTISNKPAQGCCFLIRIPCAEYE